MSTFNYDAIPVGYYHNITLAGNPVRRAWHIQKFERVLSCLPKKESQSILDIGCFAGTFLSMLPQEKFARQLGVDILKRQIDFANHKFGTKFREFRHIQNSSHLGEFDEQFDCVTLIEVIEHLTVNQITQMLDVIREKLKKGGKLVISTPNYTSSWPLLEIIVNRMSDVSYEEQHLTKFNYFTVERKLKKIYPALEKSLKLDFKTTTHFISPFLASISLPFALKISQCFPHRKWHFPFGNLVLLVFTRV